MYSIDHRDLGTPPAKSADSDHARNRRRERHRARGHLDHAGRGARRCANPETLRHRLAEGVRILPPVPGRGRRPQGLPGVLHDPGRARHEGSHAVAEAAAAPAQRRGALRVRSPARLRRLPGEWTLRAAGCSRGHGRHAVPLGTGQVPARHGAGRQQSVFRFQPGPVHRLLALRPRLRRDAEHPRADDRGPRFRLARVGERAPALPRLRVRLLRRLRRGLPDCGAQRKVAGDDGRAAEGGHDDLRLLRRRLLAEGRGQGRASHPHGPEPRRRRQPGPRLHQGPFRLRLCDP